MLHTHWNTDLLIKSLCMHSFFVHFTAVAQLHAVLNKLHLLLWLSVNIRDSSTFARSTALKSLHLRQGYSGWFPPWSGTFFFAVFISLSLFCMFLIVILFLSAGPERFISSASVWHILQHCPDSSFGRCKPGSFVHKCQNLEFWQSHLCKSKMQPEV